jgi:branched-subunit amino acid aminotransferase/4-amino-4-deoxychorismate lyase
MKYAVRNCELIPEEEAQVPVTRREVFFGFAVYESLKVLEGVPLFVEEHLDRLFESARVLRLVHSFTRGAIAESFRQLASANELAAATLRMLLVGGEEPELFAYATELPVYPEEYYRSGAQAISYRGERVFPRAKSSSLLLNYVAGREASERGALEALLVDRKGRALEGTRSNLFAVRGGELVTAGEDVLSGVTRKHILDSFEESGGRIRYEKLALEELLTGRCEEVFISSTSMGAMPLRSIDGRNILPEQSRGGRGSQGETAARAAGGREDAAAADSSPASHFPVTARLNEVIRLRERREIEAQR